jgi:uncharacterized protein YdhG (YjbR/CyaY superfamily)
MTKTIDEYITSCPKSAHATLEELRQIIQEAVPTARPAISYGIGAFRLSGKYLIYFGGYEHHVSVYPRPHGNDEALQKDLAPYESGKGTLRFSLDKPLPANLIKRVVLALEQEHKERYGR